MQDLSSYFAADPIAALCPTGQTTGAQADNRNARTAPGTVPAAPHADQPAVVVDAIAHTETTLKDGHEAANPSPFTGNAGAGWVRTAGRSFPNTGGPAETRQALLNSNPGRRQR